MIIRDDYTRRLAIEQLERLDLKGPILMTVKPYKEKRSTAQNSLYWLWLGIIGADLGNNKDEIHAVMAHKFLAPEIKEIMGEQIEIIKSTTKLNIHEFTEYLNQIEIFASGFLNIILPRPEDMYFHAMGYERRGK